MEIVHTFNLVYDVVNGYFGEKVRLYFYDFFCLVSSRKFVFHLYATNNRPRPTRTRAIDFQLWSTFKYK